MKIAVGLSGGVDSSVAALILKNQGHDVIALFMQNWHDTTGTLYGDCPWKDDRAIAEMVARKLDIPFHFVDLSSEYSKRVVDYMFSEYQKGRTPNPDVLCNREIKFEVFLKSALDLGAEYVATGHYCRKETIKNSDGSETYRLLAGKDPNKDQSYFLCQLTQKQLSKALFPIGDLLKPQVREMASIAELPSADKKDSQGICFVGKVDLPVFLQQKLHTKSGDVIEVFPSFFDQKEQSNYNFSGYENIDDEFLKSASQPVIYTKESGKRIGEHQGAHFYTIGQRKGLNIGGHKDPLFIISTDVNENLIFVGEGQNHKGLFRKALFIDSDEIHWVRPDLKMVTGEVREYLLRIRYRQPLQRAKLFMKSEGLYVVFNEPQRGITPGQFAAWYENDELIGSGVIMS
ncbi:MAG: tRNA 2-thiouridine(34) synthase MnmA [Bacteroidales bacterium]|nr:tRNA 2-thiouridine(34) synthase MnmA [Bacteroidales bacterium]